MKASSPNGTQGDASSSPAMNRSGRWYSSTTRSRLVSLMADASISVVVEHPGRPVTAGPPRDRAEQLVVVTPGNQFRAQPGRQVAPAGHRINGHDLCPRLRGDQDGGKPDRARAEHHDALAGVCVRAL